MKSKIAFATAVCLLFLVAGCCITPPVPPVNPNTTGNQTTNGTLNQTVPCSDRACFVQAANECKDMSVTLVEDAGTFTYSSSSNCTLTKTLISMDANESADLKNLLQGKSMTCPYARGAFDSRLVGSLLFGIENCSGELKDDIGRLIVFTVTE